MATDKRFPLAPGQQLTSEIITNLYLYENINSPNADELLSSDLIRPQLNIPDTAITASDISSNVNLVTVEVDAVPYMETGAGRFANGSQFELVKSFFDPIADILLSPGTYDKQQINNFLFQNQLTSFTARLELRNYEDDVDDFGERVYIWNSSEFSLPDNVEFVVNPDGTKEIKNFRIEPNRFPQLNFKENFDFDTANPFVEQFSKLELKPRVDPSEIGRTVFIDFFNRSIIPVYDPVNTGDSFLVYDEEDYQHDLQKEASTLVNPITQNTSNLIRVRNETVPVANNLFNNGISSFLYNEKPILYGTVDNDTLSASRVTENISESIPLIDYARFPLQRDKARNGVVIVAGEGNDTLIGGFSNFSDDDILVGNEGDDLLDGMGGDDTAVFSDIAANYDIEPFDTIFAVEEYTVTHSGGTGQEGTDTLKNIELAQFSDSATDLRDGSINTSTTDILSSFNQPIGSLSLAAPVQIFDGDAEYTVTLSAVEPDVQYNIAYMIDVSFSMTAAELQATKDAYIELTNFFIDEGLADNINFAVIPYNDSASLIEPATPADVIATIQGLSTTSGSTSFTPAFAEAKTFFTNAEDGFTNIAYMTTDGQSLDNFYGSDLIALRSNLNTNVQVLGFGDNLNAGQLNQIDSDDAVILPDTSELTARLGDAGFADSVASVDVKLDGSLIDTIDVADMVETPLGLSYTGSVSGLDVSLGANNALTAEAQFVSSPVTSAANPQNVPIEYTIASSLDNSGIDPLTNVASGNAGDDEIILGSIDLGANGNSGNDKLVGNNFGNVLDGGSGDDRIFGHDGNDIITAGAGEDFIDGGAGFDTVAYVGQLLSDAVIEQRGNVTTINSVDTIVNVEYLQFSDVRVDADTLEVVPTLSGTDIIITEGDTGTSTAQFTVNLDTPATSNVQFSYETIDLDALASEDYTAASGTVTIPSGSTSATIDVEITGDTVYELDETFTLNLSAISGATFSDYEEEYTLFANITNDDPEPTSNPEPPTTQIIAEYGVIDNLTHELQTISLSNSFTNPVVFVQPLSFNGDNPATIRLQDIGSDSFSLFVQESCNFDGIHTTEQVSYLVLEAGTWQLPNGDTLQTGTVESEELITANWQSIAFTEAYDSTPAVFSQVQTNNDPDFIQTRQQNITEGGFEFGMEEEEATKDSTHGTERLGWFALESGNGEWSGNNYQEPIPLIKFC